VGFNISYYMSAFERRLFIEDSDKSAYSTAMISSTLRDELCSKYGIYGNLGGSVNACSASVMSVGDSYRMIKDGY